MGFVSWLALATLRLMQFVFALTVCGLYSPELQKARALDTAKPSNWTWAEIVGAFSAFSSFLYVIPAVMHIPYVWVWDVIMAFCWMIVFAIFGNLYISNANTVNDPSVARMKTAVWIDLINMFLWIISAAAMFRYWWNRTDTKPQWSMKYFAPHIRRLRGLPPLEGDASTIAEKGAIVIPVPQPSTTHRIINRVKGITNPTASARVPISNPTYVAQPVPRYVGPAAPATTRSPYATAPTAVYIASPAAVAIRTGTATAPKMPSSNRSQTANAGYATTTVPIYLHPEAAAQQGVVGSPGRSPAMQPAMQRQGRPMRPPKRGSNESAAYSDEE